MADDLDINEHNYDASDDESEIAQQHSLHIHMNAVHKIRSALTGPGSDVCLDCDIDIPKQRRIAVPWAVRCVDCQEYHEKITG
jgi:phage/conjugal plasmid C-4 type zinc finger TraR family protein